MTRNRFIDEIVEPRLSLIREVLAKKNTEYASHDDVFKAFVQSTSFSLHQTPQATAWEFMVKHLQSIQQMVSDYEKVGKLPDESVLDEKIGDAINYMILIEGMFKEALIPRKVEEARVKYTLI